jgi:hypothetical protein
MRTHSQSIINLKFILLFIPAAYFAYLFHEFGHWIVGEILGNDMAYSLNYVWPRSGHYIGAGHDLYVSIGGPSFSILQSLCGLLIIEKYKSRYVYPFAFFPMFNRFFSLLCGGFSKQDEARISGILGAGTYTVAIIVLLILVLIVMRCSSQLRIGFKDNSYVVTLSTLCQLLVIGTYKLIL